MFAPLMAILACTTRTVLVSREQPGCEETDFPEPDVESLQVDEGDLAVRVSHTGVIQPCDATFTPQVELDRRTLVVHEEWEGGGDCAETCFSPTIEVKDPPSGKYEVEWYDGGSLFGTVEFEVE